MAVAYAARADLASWLGADAPAQAERMLERATELIDQYVTAPFDVDSTTTLPTDTTVAAALRDAVCAQVEYWLVGVGEESDIVGQRGTVTVAGFSGAAPVRVAPRAKTILHTANLASPRVRS